MSLDYRLPGEMTNGDLAEEHPDMYESLFNICSIMMACGVRALNDKEQFLTRVAMITTLNIRDHERQPKTLDFYARAFDVLEGMTTNVSQDSDAAFRKRMAESLERDGKRVAVQALQRQQENANEDEEVNA